MCLKSEESRHVWLCLRWCLNRRSGREQQGAVGVIVHQTVQLSDGGASSWGRNGGT